MADEDLQAMRTKASSAMVSSLDEYCPPEFMELLDEVANLRAQLAARSSPPTDRQDLEDDLEQVIGDSIDMDWTSRDGARAIINWLDEQGYALAIAEPDQKPSAFLKSWTMPDSDHPQRVRVDMREDHEPWLDALKPTVEPLYPLAVQLGWRKIILETAQLLRSYERHHRDEAQALQDAADKVNEEGGFNVQVDDRARFQRLEKAQRNAAAAAKLEALLGDGPREGEWPDDPRPVVRDVAEFDPPALKSSRASPSFERHCNGEFPQ